MKRIFALVALVFVMLSTSQSQTWDYFFHPRLNGLTLSEVTAPFEWQFHPTLTINATCVRPGLGGVSTDVEFLSAAGPALTLQHTGVALDGSNYADYSANLSLLLSGSTLCSRTLNEAVISFVKLDSKSKVRF